MKLASREQITALLTLYAQWQAHYIQADGDPRKARLSWAMQEIGREIASFNELSADEARQLIDLLKSATGQPLTRKPAPWRRVRARDRAHAAGTDGRKGAEHSSVIQLAGDDDFARIEDALRRLGWDLDRYAMWLRSPSSPLRNRDLAVRTMEDANKVWWALKAMLVRAGKWQPRKHAAQRLDDPPQSAESV